jgi:hypothetical protein
MFSDINRPPTDRYSTLPTLPTCAHVTTLVTLPTVASGSFIIIRRIPGYYKRKIYVQRFVEIEVLFNFLIDTQDT